MTDLNAILSPGMFVKHPEHPEWGLGQVQSNAAGKITVNFRDQGKLVFASNQVLLIPVFEP